MKHKNATMVLNLLIVAFCFLGCVKTTTPDTQKSCEIGDIRDCDEGTSTGVCEKPRQTCLGDNIWTVCSSEIRPSREICDGLDNDCDGEVDEYVKNACGECGDEPNEVCDGLDNDCDGEIDERFADLPELCNGLDDDCDGIEDEGLTKRKECAPEGAGDWIIYNSDPNSRSICTLGWKTCDTGEWSECFEWRGPEPEICDGWDNDCNGYVDEIEFYENPCGLTSEGVCELGIEACIASEMVCVGGTDPENEICDALDNDCDGLSDESLERQCETACGIGVEFCNNGIWRSCTAPAPVMEICDGLDNDCDGLIDEEIECDCELGQSQPCPNTPCGWGIKICSSDGTWGDCQGNIPQSEMCNNHDDNCNEIIDEDLQLTCFDGDFDLVGTGLCEAGISICEAGIWGPCEDQILPAEESCDGLDNDCDGAIDNLERYFEKVDLVFAIDVSGSMDVFIHAVIDGLATYVASLEGTDHKFGVVLFGSNQDPFGLGEPFLYLQLTDVNSFIDSLDRIITQGSDEPSVDTIYELANPANNLQIAWRSNATPILVLIGDENLQSQRGLMISDIQQWTEVCQLPGCNNATNENWLDGDPVELFIWAGAGFMNAWSETIYAAGQRVFNILRMLSEELLALDLELIFKEICIDP